MPAKKSKGTVAKKRPSHGGKQKVNKANKTKTKATKRKTQMKKRQTKQAQKRRKERKKADKAKRTAKKKKTKKSKKSKDKKKKKAKKPEKQKPAEPKQEPDADDGEDDDEAGEEALHMKLAGMSVNQMQNLRKSVTEMTKEEFLEQIMDHGEHRSEEIAFQAAYMTTPENRTKLFYDSERPTDSSAGPFQSNRFGAVFLIPGQQ
ncbi:unnamed protein product [Caenorhabditis nigoni]